MTSTKPAQIFDVLSPSSNNDSSNNNNAHQCRCIMSFNVDASDSPTATFAYLAPTEPAQIFDVLSLSRNDGSSNNVRQRRGIIAVTTDDSQHNFFSSTVNCDVVHIIIIICAIVHTIPSYHRYHVICQISIG